MKRLSFLTIASVISVFLWGCAALTAPGRSQVLENEKPYWFDYGSERRGAVLIPQKTGGVIMCSEPVPRVTPTLETAGEGRVSGQAPAPAPAQGGIAAAETKGQLKAGATQINEELMVLFLREALYRLCEMTVNLGSVEEDYKKQVLSLYTEVIGAAVNLSGKTDKIQSEQIRARTLDKYLDILAQFQKATNDASINYTQNTLELREQIGQLRAELGQSVSDLKNEIVLLKVPTSQPIIEIQNE